MSQNDLMSHGQNGTAYDQNATETKDYFRMCHKTTRNFDTPVLQIIIGRKARQKSTWKSH